MLARATVGQLLARGDRLAIDQGRFVFESFSGLAVNGWSEEHRDQLVAEILECSGNTNAFLYESYSTGMYRIGPYWKPGVTLQFSCPITARTPYTVFNAGITRVKATARGSVGSLLPTGQFRVGKQSDFYKFWQVSGLGMPARLSSFYDYMGNLKKIIFTGRMTKDKPDRLISGSICPVNVSYEQILIAHGTAGLPANSHTKSIQDPYSGQTEVPYTVSLQRQLPQGFQPNQTAGGDNCGTSNQGAAGLRGDGYSSPLPKRPIDQTTDEWLFDYVNGE